MITAIAFLGVTAAWLYDVNVFSPALNHDIWEYVFVAGPYVVVGVFCLVNYLVRANFVFSVYGLVGALIIAVCGLGLWYQNFFVHGNDLGFGIGTLFQCGVAVAISGTGWAAMLLYKGWQWFVSKPLSSATDRQVENP